MAAAVGSGVSGEGRSEKGRLYCPTCKVTVNSASQLQAHNTGECGPPAGVRGKEKGGETAPHQMGAGWNFWALCSRTWSPRRCAQLLLGVHFGSSH